MDSDDISYWDFSGTTRLGFLLISAFSASSYSSIPHILYLLFSIEANLIPIALTFWLLVSPPRSLYLTLSRKGAQQVCPNSEHG